MSDEQATAGASHTWVPWPIPGITLTEPEDDSPEPDKIRDSPVSATGDAFYQAASSTRHVFQELEDRYNEEPVSQADFFAPTELLSSNDAPTRRNDIIEDDDIAPNPFVPRIVLSPPETSYFSASPPETPVLKKAAPLNRTTHFLDEVETRPKRRHSVMSFAAEKQPDAKPVSSRAPPVQVQHTPRPWMLTERFPKGAWSMKARCPAGSDARCLVDIVVVYLFNSTLTKKSHDRDADLDLFLHSSPSRSEISPSRLTSAALKKPRRAMTDIGTRQKSKPSDKHSKPEWEEPRMPRGRRVNWLQDHDMIREHIPNSRVIAVGFDVASTLSSSPDLPTAAAQLREYLDEQRYKVQRRPIVFIGHTLGGMIILQMLSNMTNECSSSSSPVSNTAGVFLFSCSLAHSEDRSKVLAQLFGLKTSDKLLTDIAANPALKQLSKSARVGLFAQHPLDYEVPTGPTCRPKSQQKAGCVMIGFPIFQVFGREEIKENKVAESISAFLGSPVRTVTIGTDASDVMRFESPNEPDYLRLVALIRASVQSHRLLHAAAAGQWESVSTMIHEGINVNLRDRWSQTALQIAVRRNDEAMVRTLCQVDGLEVNARDKRLNTPLHYAIRAGNETIIRALLHHGAEISLENSKKRTPRDLAEKHKSRKHIAKLLKSRLMQGPDQSLASKRIGTGTSPTSTEGRLACRSFQVTVTEIYATHSSDEHWSVNISIEALLYDSVSLSDILDQVRPREIKSESLVCTWIHVPENNMIWLEDLFAKLNLHKAIWEDTRQTISESIRNRAITPHLGLGDINSVFMPYLSYELNCRQMSRTQHLQRVDEAFRRRQQDVLDPESAMENTVISMARRSREESRERPQHLEVPGERDLERYPYRDEDSDSDFSEIGEIDDPDDIEEEEKALIRTYLNDPPALHVRRTLDQYFYHMLESTENRDIDQVVSRWSERIRSQPRHNILMVDQLWLWSASHSIDHGTGGRDAGTINTASVQGKHSTSHKNNFIISCFPNQTGVGLGPHQPFDDLRMLVLNPDRRRRDVIRRPEDLISRILSTCLSVFDRLQVAQTRRFYQMFEDSIGSIDDNESQLFREFQLGSTSLVELNSANKFYNAQKNALLVKLLDIREEISLLVEIKDIRDEINIILSVMSIQLKLVKAIRDKSQETPILLPNSDVETLVQTDIDDFQKLDSHAQKIQDKLNSLMDLKQKAANAWEAREARETAVATGKQGNTLMVFTVVTIIFLPLSFMSSFFAIGVASFPRDLTSGEVNWPLRTLLGILFGVAFGVSMPLIIFALNMDFFSSLYKELRNNYLALLGAKFLDLFPTPRSSEDKLLVRRVMWYHKLLHIREDYLKHGSNSPPEDTYIFGKPVRDGKSGGSHSFPSTVSSRTLVDGVDVEMGQPTGGHRRGRRFKLGSGRSGDDD